MKKLILLFAVSCALLNAKPANAQFPVLDFPAIAQTISQNITLVDQKINDIKKWKSLQQAIAIIGDIKEGLEKLADWKKEIETYISLFEKGIKLIDEAAFLIEDSVRILDDAKKTIEEPLIWAQEAEDLLTEAQQLIDDAEEYKKRYEETNKQAEELLKNMEVEVNEDTDAEEEAKKQAEILDAQAQEYLKMAEELEGRAYGLYEQADELLYKMQDSYRKLEELNRQSIMNQERACMLRIKGIQYKSELKRKFCENPDHGIKLPIGDFCSEDKDSGNASDACKTFDLIGKLEKELGVNL